MLYYVVLRITHTYVHLICARTQRSPISLMKCEDGHHRGGFVRAPHTILSLHYIYVLPLCTLHQNARSTRNYINDEFTPSLLPILHST